MAPAGLAHVEAAKKDGRCEKAYAGSADMEIPEDFLTALNKLPRAKIFFCHPEQAKSVLDLLPASHCQKAGNARKTHGPNPVNAGQRDKAALKTSGSAAPGCALCRPLRAQSQTSAYPALTCRATGCTVPTGLPGIGFSIALLPYLEIRSETFC